MAIVEEVALLLNQNPLIPRQRDIRELLCFCTRKLAQGSMYSSKEAKSTVTNIFFINDPSSLVLL